MRRFFAVPGLLVAFLLTIATASAAPSTTTVLTRNGSSFRINGKPTHQCSAIEGQLPNIRMVNAIIDDESRAAGFRCASGAFDPNENTRRFVRSLDAYRAAGVLAMTIGMQGGSTGRPNADHSAFRADGSMKPVYRDRLGIVLDELDRRGMVAIISVLYAQQDQLLRDEAAVRRAVRETIDFIRERGSKNVLLEIGNEIGISSGRQKYDHTILQVARIAELVRYAKQYADGSMLVGTGFPGGWSPTRAPGFVEAADYLTLHGNNQDPAKMGRLARAMRAYGKPVLVNEEDDDNDDGLPAVDHGLNNFVTVSALGISGGYFDYSGEQKVCQSDWGPHYLRLKKFLGLVAARAKPTRTSCQTGETQPIATPQPTQQATPLPTPQPTPATPSTAIGFELREAPSGRLIGSLRPNAVVSRLPFTVVATAPANVTSVEFYLNGVFLRRERARAFAAGGDTNGVFGALPVVRGRQYQLRAEAFEDARSLGSAEVTFSVAP